MGRILSAIALVVAMVAAAVPQTAATPSDGAASSAGPAAEDGSLLVIMDVSGSMQREDGSGTSLIAGAREAVRGLVDSVPEETPVGLRLYGSEYAGDKERAGCRDTELAVPIGPVSQTGTPITRAVEQARPTGFTPIGFSLTEAADDFGPEGRRSIVLVSDGEDTCGSPAPCAAAKQLARQGIDVRIDTVGLFLADNAAARRQLQCVAKATGGSYVPADDAEELTDELTEVSSRAIQRFRASGTEIEGGPAQTQATPIEPGTSYVDDIVDGESRWYSFEGQEGNRLDAVLTDDGAAEYGCCLKVDLYDPDGESVDNDGGYSEGTATTYRLSTDNRFDDDVVAEATGTYTFQVTLDDSTGTEEYAGVDYELSVDVGESASTETPTASAEPTPSETAPTQAPPEQTEAVGDTGGGNGLLWTVIVVLGLLLLVMGGLLAAMWQRLRRMT